MEAKSATQVNLSSSKKKKNKRENVSNTFDEKFLKLLTMFDKNVSDWKSSALKGNTITSEDILKQKKDQFETGRVLWLYFSPPPLIWPTASLQFLKA